ncbi:unnamed protein product [Nippostrongylus brasiliensis]|uniref:Protein kinase domain-containing protein n=1 Tax=Nippostrongylus brasiliensis TaxID=27835 RepID=A0A0N4YQD7_NIPBR|nr:unnamed protein product [Nippostrongylus brasiliensis]
MGFIHRDIKPANMAVGVNDRARIIHIFDFGLARQYVIFGEGHKPKLRRPRKKARFRGTYRYCSINTHSRGEQGRDDDLWSLLYTLVEMRGKLPWANEYTDEVIHHFKKVTPIDDLLANCPFQLLEFAQHLETLNYYIRPDYSLLYQTMEDVRKVGHIKYSDPYDWEQEEFERLSAEKVKRKNHSVDRTQASATAITAEKFYFYHLVLGSEGKWYIKVSSRAVGMCSFMLSSTPMNVEPKNRVIL